MYTFVFEFLTFNLHHPFSKEIKKFTKNVLNPPPPKCTFYRTSVKKKF